MSDGIILAAAGVKSLKLDERISITFDSKDILPAVGQELLQYSAERTTVKKFIEKINDNETSLCAIAEKNASDNWRRL